MITRVLVSLAVLISSARAFEIDRLSATCNRRSVRSTPHHILAPLSFSPARPAMGTTSPRYGIKTCSSRHPCLSIRTTSSLLMSTLSDDDKMEKKVKGRKKRVVTGYRVGLVGYMVACLLALKKSGITAFSCYTISGPFMAAGMAHILSGAATNNRLSSNTYKRLNLCLGSYGLINLTISALVQQPTNRFWRFWLALSFVTFVNSIKGYGYGVKGWKLEGGMAVVKDDWIKGVKSTLKSLVSIPINLQALSYLAATLFVGTMKVQKVFDIVSLVRGLAAKLLHLPLFSATMPSYYFSQVLLLLSRMRRIEDVSVEQHLSNSTLFPRSCLAQWQLT